MSCYRTAGHLSWWRWRPPSVFTTTATAGSMQRQVVIISVCHKFSKIICSLLPDLFKTLCIRSHDLFRANLRLNRESQRIRRTHKTCKRWRGGRGGGQPAICNSARLATEAAERIVCTVETIWIFDCLAVASASPWFLACRWARGAARVRGVRKTGCRRLWRHTVFDSLRPTPTYCSSQGDVIQG